MENNNAFHVYICICTSFVIMFRKPLCAVNIFFEIIIAIIHLSDDSYILFVREATSSDYLSVRPYVRSSKSYNSCSLTAYPSSEHLFTLIILPLGRLSDRRGAVDGAQRGVRAPGPLRHAPLPRGGRVRAQRSRPTLLPMLKVKSFSHFVRFRRFLIRHSFPHSLFTHVFCFIILLTGFFNRFLHFP